MRIRGKRTGGTLVGGALFSLALLVASAAAPAVVAADDDGRPPGWISDKPLVIAHQGGDGLWPSNTMVAFENAAALGVDVLEMDVHLSSDDHLVVIHDDTVDRTTDGSGEVASMTLVELQELDAAHNWPTLAGHELEGTTPFRGQGVQIPALEEVLVAFPDKLLNIEIKPNSRDAAEALCSKLRDHNATDRVLVASFHPRTIRAFRRDCPEVLTSSPTNEVAVFYFFWSLGWDAVLRAPSDAFQVPIEQSGLPLVTSEFGEAVKSHDMLFHAWTINDPDEIQFVLDEGVDGVITDYPDRVIEAIEGAS